MLSLVTNPDSAFLSLARESLNSLVGRMKMALLGSTMKGSTTMNVTEVEATFLSYIGSSI